MTQLGRRNFATALAALDAAPDADRLEAVLHAQAPADGATAVEAWSQCLALLAAIDRHLDTRWNPNDLPQTAVVPPRAADGTQGFAGISPKAVDAQAREHYEREIARQRAHAERYRLQYSLRRALADTLSTCSALTASAKPAQRSIFAAALDATPLSDSRRRELRTLLTGPR